VYKRTLGITLDDDEQIFFRHRGIRVSTMVQHNGLVLVTFSEFIRVLQRLFDPVELPVEFEAAFDVV
jgi:hypothetical protein